ncbi:hypothetical protein ZWY2020_008629 [Hordeum vulgare]|nr:hypothetical protein ZWY2020_008629 [Hordeum vulgare]
MRLNKVSATILANLVASHANFCSIQLDDADRKTLMSVDVVHNLLHLISNISPAVECNLLNMSLYMGAELMDALRGHLSSLFRVISGTGNSGVIEE